MKEIKQSLCDLKCFTEILLFMLSMTPAQDS